MTDSSSERNGAYFYTQGKAYSLSQDSSPSAATLARVAFVEGAKLGDTKSIRALAGMHYYGRGGEINTSEAFRLLWIAFLSKDRAALSELSDMLDDFSDLSIELSVKSKYESAARDAQEVFKRMDNLDQFLRSIKNQRRHRQTLCSNASS